MSKIIIYQDGYRPADNETLRQEYIAKVKMNHPDTDTGETYDFQLGLFYDWLNGLSVLDVIYQDLLAYRDFVFERTQNAITTINYLGTPKRFFKYLCRTGTIRKNPAARLKLPTKDKDAIFKIPPTLEEIRKLYEAIDSLPDGGIKRRGYIILDLLAKGGVRIGGIATMRRIDIKYHAGRWVAYYKPKGKVSYTKFIPLENSMLRSIKNYQEWLLKSSIESNWLLSGHGPRSIQGEQIKVGSIRDFVYKLCDSAGIRRICPHAFRHGVACLLETMYGKESATKMLGHESAQSTEDYLKMNRTKNRMATMKKVDIDAKFLDKEKTREFERKFRITHKKLIIKMARERA